MNIHDQIKLSRKESIGRRILGSVRKLSRPGDTVQESGLYNVIHDTAHVEPHQVTCVKGNIFPPCRGCGKGIRYSLAEPALHLSEHPYLVTGKRKG